MLHIIIIVAYISPVPERRVEGLSLWVEQVPDVPETSNFKHLWFLLNNLSAQVGQTVKCVHMSLCIHFNISYSVVAED